jgi:tetratricopeptide (TPR) repeat protein
LTAPEIFLLFYIRLSCLILIDGAAIAADESKALQDLNSSFYRDEDTHLHFVPWELRVLAVRLQGIGYGDARRAISGYYDLARDAREAIARTSGEERFMWKERLEDLGLRVGNALIESGDVSGAIRHFKGLRMSTKGEKNELLSGRLAMLYIQLGDLASAKVCMDEAKSAHNGKNFPAALYPLLSMAEGRYDDAIKEWEDILSDSKSIMATQNLAVCLIYVGRMDEVGIWNFLVFVPPPPFPLLLQQSSSFYSHFN